MSARAVAALVAGVVACAVVRGAVAALVAASTTTMLAAAAALVGLCIERAAPRRELQRGVFWFVVGAALALALPNAPAPVTGPVANRPVGAHREGDLFALLDRLDRNPGAVILHRVAVSGRWRPASGGDLPAVFRPIMTCCAADVVAVGFDVEERRHRLAPARCPFVRVAGIVRAVISDGDLRYRLADATVACVEPSSKL